MSKFQRSALRLALLLTLFCAACGSNAPPTSQAPQPGPSPTALATPGTTPADIKQVAVGTWGGQGVRLEVTEGVSTVEFDCAHGLLRAPLQLGDSNQFAVNGTYTPEGGATPEGSGPQNFPALYVGEVFGDEMDLTVTYTTVDPQPRPTLKFRLHYRASLRLNKCL